MSKTAYKDRNLLFIDTETGGLNPEEAELLEIGYVLTDCSGEKILSKGEWKILPEHPELIEFEAKSLNGYTDEVWAKEGVPLREAFSQLAKATVGAKAVGHNINFDLGFLQAAARKTHISPSWVDYHSVDTASYAHVLAYLNLLPGVKLKHFTEGLGLTQGAAHTALADAEDCRRVYVAFMKLVGPVLLADFENRKKEIAALFITEPPLTI